MEVLSVGNEFLNDSYFFNSHIVWIDHSDTISLALAGFYLGHIIECYYFKIRYHHCQNAESINKISLHENDLKKLKLDIYLKIFLSFFPVAV